MVLALCFLVYDKIQNRRLWEAWLKGHEDDVRVFIHSKFIFEGLDFPHIVIDTVPTKWGGYGIVEATLRLFEKAIKECADVSHCILVSGDCIPIKRFSYVHSFCSKERSYIKESERIQIFPRYKELLKFYPDTVISKHSQWVILCRNHAQQLVDNEKQIEPIFSKVSIPDETWILTWLYKDRSSISTSAEPMYVDWSVETPPRIFNSIPDEATMKKLLLGPHLFARKFLCDMSFLSTLIC